MEWIFELTIADIDEAEADKLLAEFQKSAEQHGHQLGGGFSPVIYEENEHGQDKVDQ